MAETLYLKDGTVEVILPSARTSTEDCFARLLEDKLGYDVAKYFRQLLADREEEIREEAREEAQSCDERLADGYRAMCIDARDRLGRIAEALRRSNREKIYTMAEVAYLDLDRNL